MAFVSAATFRDWERTFESWSAGPSATEQEKCDKRLRNEMADKGIVPAQHMPSYLIECLAWNVPDEGFNRGGYRADVRYALAHLFNNTRKDELCSEWGEINELKYLFRLGQPWTRQLAHEFVDAAWNYIGFED